MKLQRQIAGVAFQGQCETKWEDSGFFPPDCFTLSSYNSLNIKALPAGDLPLQLVPANDGKCRAPETASL